MLKLFRRNPIKQAEKECLAAWEAAPTATWAWHLHHERLWEKIGSPFYETRYTVEDRVEHIISNKPEIEKVTRLNLFRPIKNQSLAIAWDKSYWDNYERSSLRKQMEDLHRVECLNCPWDGYTIFPRPLSPVI